MRGAIGSAGLVLQREAPLPVRGCKKTLEVCWRLVVGRPLILLLTIRRENACVKHELVCIVRDLLAGVWR